MHTYILQIKGTDSNNKGFVENIKVGANNEYEARVNANNLFMIPGPQGLSSKYDNGLDAVTHWIESTVLLEE